MQCDILGNFSKKNPKPHERQEHLDSPLQVQLIKFLGLKDFFVDKFVFKRKPPKYELRLKNGVPGIFISSQQYSPPEQLDLTVKIIENSSHSVPLAMFTHKCPQDNFVIVYSHGNSSDLGDTLYFLEHVALNFNVDVVGYDYSGYGQSRVAVIGEQTIVKDLELVLSWLKRPLNRIILWGFSLGSYPAVCIAGQYPVAGLVLQCPIASINCIFEKKISASTKFKQDHFSNLEAIQNVNCPTFLVHSLEDEIIPISHSRVLFQKFVSKNGKDFIWFLEIAKLKHNSLHRFFTSKNDNDLKNEFAGYMEMIRSLIRPALPDPQHRIDLRFMIVDAELDDDEQFVQQKFQLLALSETQGNCSPGRKFTQNRRIIPRCFD